MQRRQGRVNAGLLLLLYQISQVGLQNIPSVTLGVLALNIFFFLNPVRPLPEVCISVNEGFYRKNWQRLLLSPVHHADDWHLYYNMISMLWKGIMLEKKLKSTWFAYIIVVFSVLIGVVYMALEFMLVKILDDPSYEMNCAVGFSGVLFALKVLNNHYNPGRVSSVFGLQISSKYACWVELVAIHLISPGASFAGHLAGILVGLMYTRGPLKRIMEACAGGIFSLSDPARPRDYYSDYYGYSGYQYGTPRNYYDYTGGLTEEEQLERAVLNSLTERGLLLHVNPYRPFGILLGEAQCPFRSSVWRALLPVSGGECTNVKMPLMDESTLENVQAANVDLSSFFLFAISTFLCTFFLLPSNHHCVQKETSSTVFW